MLVSEVVVSKWVSRMLGVGVGMDELSLWLRVVCEAKHYLQTRA